MAHTLSKISRRIKEQNEAADQFLEDLFSFVPPPPPYPYPSTQLKIMVLAIRSVFP